MEKRCGQCGCVHEEIQDQTLLHVEQPYIIKKKIVLEASYNPKYGDDRTCECGHTYYRHFDTYEEMCPVGCKYCECAEFVEKMCKCDGNEQKACDCGK